MKTVVRFLLISIAICLQAGFSAACHAQVTSNVLRRVRLIRIGNETGTAFTIEVDGRQYLITAKHVAALLSNNQKSTINIMSKSGWKSLDVTAFKCDDPVDIAILVPPRQLTVSFQLEPTSDGLSVGQDAFFVGFPYGGSITYQSSPDVFGFVKRATVAGIEVSSENRVQVIDLDGYNNPGFSGSPLVFRDLSQSGLVYKVAGVVVNFIYDATTVLKKKQEVQLSEVTADDLQAGNVVRTITDGKLYRVEDTNQLVKLNTGIARAWDIRSAVELVRKHPIGPVADPNFNGMEMQ